MQVDWLLICGSLKLFFPPLPLLSSPFQFLFFSNLHLQLFSRVQYEENQYGGGSATEYVNEDAQIELWPAQFSDSYPVLDLLMQQQQKNIF